MNVKMSSFIVQDETINNIISFLYSGSRLIYMDNQLKRKGIETKKDFEKLGKAFKLMNLQAVNQRYNESNDLVQVVKYNFKFKEINIFQALKSMHCLSYQACEGNVPNQEIYKFLDQIIRATESHIIDEIKEYKDSKWD